VTPNATNGASAGEAARTYNSALHKRANNPKTFPESGGLRIETFEKRSISFKIKAHEDFNHRNILNISRIKIRMQRRDWQRRDWAKGGIFQRSRIRLPKSGMPLMPDTQILEVS